MWLMKKSWWDKVIGKLETKGYGPHFQDSTEMVFKTWKAGGRLMLNKTTWYAHKHRSFDRTHQYSTERSIPEWLHAIDVWYDDYMKILEQWGEPVKEQIVEKKKVSGRIKMEDGIGIAYVSRNCPFRMTGERQFPVEQLWLFRETLADPVKKGRLHIFWDIFEDFTDALLEGKKYSDTSDPRMQAYFDYLVGALNPAFFEDYRVGGTLKKSGIRYVRGKMKDGKKLLNDIQKNGLKFPLEMYMRDEKAFLTMMHGARRLVILHKLGIPMVSLRIADSRKSLKLHESCDQWQSKRTDLPSIHEVSMQDFMEHKGEATDKYWAWGYTKIYDRLWTPEYRNKKLRILEIGVARGYSLRWLYKCFPKAQIIGVDRKKTLWKKTVKELKDRVHVVIGDQNDDDFMEKIAAYGPFDIIIDDGDHSTAMQWKTYGHLWKALKNHGWYVVEDCGKNYFPTVHKKAFPTYLGSLVPKLYEDHSLESLFFHNGICVIQKGLNK